MIVVSNSSPIFYLSTIGQLDLLRQLYAKSITTTLVPHLLPQVLKILLAY